MKPPVILSYACVLLLVLDGQTVRAQGRRGVGVSNTAAAATFSGTPNAPVTPAFYPIPTQNYAVLDVSGDDPTNNPVSGIGLRDDNQLAFSVSQREGEKGTVAVRKWLNGTFTAGETIQMYESWSVWSPEYMMLLPAHTIYHVIQDYLMSADGALCGNKSEFYYGFKDNGGDLPFYVIKSKGFEAFSGAGSGPSLEPPFKTPDAPAHDDDGVPLPAYHTEFIGGSYSGAAMYRVPGYGNLGDKLDKVSGLLICSPSATSAPFTLLYAYPTTAVSSAGLNIINQSGYMDGEFINSYNLVNSKGWAIFDPSAKMLWSGQGVINLPDVGVCLNESNDVLIGNQDNQHPEHLGILRKGAAFVPFFRAGGVPGLIPEQFQKEVMLAPVAMSNRLDLPAAPVRPVLHILCVGSILRPSGAWESTGFLLREMSEGTTDLRETILPPLFDYNSYRINAQGVLGIAGDPSGAAGSIGVHHALLLLPVDYDELKPASGFDKYTQPHWLMVPQFGSNFAQAYTPASAVAGINFAMRPASPTETVAPATASVSPQTTTVHGETAGDAHKVAVGLGNIVGKSGELSLSVKPLKTVKVAIHAIMQTTDGGVTGLSPQGVPTAAEAQAYLNQVYEPQTNTYFTVTRTNYGLNYDTGGGANGAPNGKLVYDYSDSAVPNSVGHAVTRLKAAYIKNFSSATSSLHVLAHELGHLLGIRYHSDADFKSNAWFLKGTDATMRLMVHQPASSQPNPKVLIKAEWDTVNPVDSK